MSANSLFITLEGIEGVGKTTAVTTVQQTLTALGHETVLTREPGGTPLGEQLRALLLDPASAGMAPTAELLLMFAARAQHLQAVIEPALAAGRSVICDRFTDASFAYQGGGRGLDMGLIEQAQQLVHPHLQPHLTLLLDAPPELALSRAHARSSADRFERETIDFFTRVREQYLTRARRFAARFVVIDASQSLSDVTRSIETCLRMRCQ